MCVLLKEFKKGEQPCLYMIKTGDRWLISAITYTLKLVEIKY